MHDKDYAIRLATLYTNDKKLQERSNEVMSVTKQLYEAIGYDPRLHNIVNRKITSVKKQRLYYSLLDDEFFPTEKKTQESGLKKIIDSDDWDNEYVEEGFFSPSDVEAAAGDHYGYFKDLYNRIFIPTASLLGGYGVGYLGSVGAGLVLSSGGVAAGAVIGGLIGFLGTLTAFKYVTHRSERLKFFAIYLYKYIGYVTLMMGAGNIFRKKENRKKFLTKLYDLERSWDKYYRIEKKLLVRKGNYDYKNAKYKIINTGYMQKKILDKLISDNFINCWDQAFEIDRENKKIRDLTTVKNFFFRNRNTLNVYDVDGKMIKGDNNAESIAPKQRLNSSYVAAADNTLYCILDYLTTMYAELSNVYTHCLEQSQQMSFKPDNGVEALLMLPSSGDCTELHDDLKEQYEFFLDLLHLVYPDLKNNNAGYSERKFWIDTLNKKVINVKSGIHLTLNTPKKELNPSLIPLR